MGQSKPQTPLRGGERGTPPYPADCYEGTSRSAVSYRRFGYANTGFGSVASPYAPTTNGASSVLFSFAPTVLP